MTAEIAIINRSGIALAADSALTIGRDRVWKNSNKLFHLSPASDVGVMFYGSGDYCGLPWEVVLKEFRKKLGKSTKSNLKDYVEEFLIFLDDLTVPNTPLRELQTLFLFMNAIAEVSDQLSAANAIKRREQVISVANELERSAIELPILFEEYNIDDFKRSFEKKIRELMVDQLKMHITNGMVHAILKLCFERTRRTFESTVETGVVFAGYGHQELLPVVMELCVDGALEGKVRAWKIQEANMNTGTTASGILPFAQADIAKLFVEGTLPQYVSYTERTLLLTLNRKSDELVQAYVPDAEKVVERARQHQANKIMVDTFAEKFKEYRHDESVKSLMRVVNSLPKEEMALLAEALVETTSLRRKMDSNLETVGGPVDVAIVSKSDGFIWIKRKHYFDISLNRDFIDRRNEKYQGGNNDA